jgi:ParB family transcriptional regulator, chromosome partitioning protein
MSADRTPVPLPARRRRRPASGPSDAAAVFGVRSAARPEDALRELDVAAIERNPRQPRRRFDPKALQALAESIRHRGVLQPVLVRPVADGHYELVAGERRWRAAQEAGLERIPAFVRDADDTLTLELGLIENIVREDLTPVEEARTLVTLIEDLGVSQRALAERIGRSQPDISNTIRLLDLPDSVLDLLDGGRLTKGHGKVLLSEADHGRRRDLAQRAASDGWSVRELERAVSASGRRAAQRRRTADPDAAATAGQLADELETALGAPVKVRPREAGFSIQIVAADLRQAESIVRRLRPSTRG